MFPAFRSTELSGGLVEMIFTCTLQVCLGSCAPSSCNGGRVIDEGYGRKKRDIRRSTSFEEVAYDEVNVGATLSIGTDIDIKPNKPKEGESICIHNATFIAGLFAMFGVLVTSVSLTTYATGKMLKQSEHIRKLTSDNEALQKAASDSKVSDLNKPLTQI
ncbi:hypothetical protein DPMN_068315 [Dreissena polymorpha]|uniref:ZP domain-containing protein n=2 Tax=Dreissena polymorpha TaxID=45954 RepID=A0A9D4BM42_DREPO|nr:hypothetical protein DPMN_068315 [Dreissena polymorpha]